jgi:hypothetical protein
LRYNDYRHGEIDSFTKELNTLFNNKTFNCRGVLDQRKKGQWSGSFGFWGLHRDYSSSGAEALAPPTLQNAFAVFALQKPLTQDDQRGLKLISPSHVFDGKRIKVQPMKS